MLYDISSSLPPFVSSVVLAYTHSLMSSTPYHVSSLFLSLLSGCDLLVLSLSLRSSTTRIYITIPYAPPVPAGVRTRHLDALRPPFQSSVFFLICTRRWEGDLCGLLPLPFSLAFAFVRTTSTSASPPLLHPHPKYTGVCFALRHYPARKRRSPQPSPLLSP